MPPRFTVLGSGSSGNSTLVQYNGCRVMIDAGLGPRQTASRLQACDCDWSDLDAVLLTHTHGDHWKDGTFKRLLQHDVVLYCHERHVRHLAHHSEWIIEMKGAGLIRHYVPESENLLPGEARLIPFEVSHDSGPTFGFRIEHRRSLSDKGWVLAYAADLGTWSEDLVPMLANADLLALEFNHDVRMQRASQRPEFLIERILGDQGHLSNVQAANLLAAVLQASAQGRLQKLVQLHLSRECNRPELARKAAGAVLRRRQCRVELLTASQQEVTPAAELDV